MALLERKMLRSFVRMYNTPRRNPIDTDAEKDMPEFVFAGENTKSHTRVYAMGVSEHGGLGLLHLLFPSENKKSRVYKYMFRPHRLEFAEKIKVIDVGCGYGFTVLAVSAKDSSLNGSCFGTGICGDCQIGRHLSRKGRLYSHVITPTQIELPFKSKVKKVACGRAHTLLLSEREGLWTLGNNAYGQCGRPTIADEDYSKRPVFYNAEIFKDKVIDQLECGLDCSFVLTGGTVYSCGWSADGQTGLGTYDNQEEFKEVSGDLKGENIVKVSASADTVLALTDKGDLFGWGNAEYRQFPGDKTQVSEPLHVNIKVGRIIDIAASGSACFVLNDQGDVYSWGFGILGRGPKNLMSEVPEQIPPTLLGRTMLNPESKVKQIFAGPRMGGAITSEGGLYTWGKNKGGMLGLRHLDIQYFPMRVCIAGVVKKVSVGVDHLVLMVKGLM